MEHSYSYPLDPSWSTDEIVVVVEMLRAVEDAYETGVNRQHVIDAYRQFKKVVSTKSGEKQLGRQFAKLSGYELYDVVKTARESSDKKIKLEVAKR